MNVTNSKTEVFATADEANTTKASEDGAIQRFKSSISLMASNFSKVPESKTEVSATVTPKETSALTSLKTITEESEDGASSEALKSQTSTSGTSLIASNVTKSENTTFSMSHIEEESVISSDGKNLEIEAEEGIPDKEKMVEVMSPMRLIELAHEKAKDVLDNAFHLVIAQVLLFFQNSNCQLSEDAFSRVGDGSFQLSDAYDCSVGDQFKDLNKEFWITLSIAIYGFLIATIVIIHAIRYRESGESPIQNIYKWTDRIPIIDSLLEIPIAMWISPFVTIFLWAVFLACCTGLIVLIVSYNEAAFENGNTSSFALTAFLVGFDLYRMTGNISQYYVTHKSAKADAREKKKIKELIAAPFPGSNFISSRSLGSTRVSSVPFVTLQSTREKKKIKELIAAPFPDSNFISSRSLGSTRVSSVSLCDSSKQKSQLS